MFKLFIYTALVILVPGLIFKLHGMSTKDSYGEDSLSSVHSNGSVKLNGTYVEADVHVSGSLYAINSDIGSIRLNGSGDLKNTRVRNESHINGTLKADACNFQGEISVASSLVHFRKCKTCGILVKEVGDFNDQQQIIFEDGTEVHGDITFQFGNGVVILKGLSQISGKVFGGSVQRG